MCLSEVLLRGGRQPRQQGTHQAAAETGAGPGAVMAMGVVGVSAAPFLSVSEPFSCT